MNEAVQERALANEPRGELAFRMRMAPRLRKLLGGVVAGWQVFATARRIAAAVELHRMPAKEDLAFLGVEDATVFRRHIGQ